MSPAASTGIANRSQPCRPAQLNKGESLHALRRGLYYATRAPLARLRPVRASRGTAARETIGAKPLRDLTATQVRTALAALGEQLSSRSLQIARRSLQRAIKYAEANDKVGPERGRAGRHASRPGRLAQACLHPCPGGGGHRGVADARGGGAAPGAQGSRIVVGVDGSEGSKEALRYAARQASFTGAGR